jgi:hypothetical protein
MVRSTGRTWSSCSSPSTDCPRRELGREFIEFPSIPRIAINSDALATRGNHRPVWAIGSEDERVGAPLETVADTTTDGEVLDPAAQGLPVTELGLERDGFRGNNSSSTREWASNKAKRATAGPGST